MSPSEHLTWYCLTTAYREGFRYSGEQAVSIDFCIQYRYACSAAHLFSASGRTTEKNKEKMGVYMCVCACPCVWRGVHGPVCV